MRLLVKGIEVDAKALGRELSLKIMAMNFALEAGCDGTTAEAFAFSVARVAEGLNPDTERLDKLRQACGYIENGTSGSVTLSQDDATKDWIVSAGRDRGWGTSLRVAIDKLEVRDDDQA